MVVYREITRLYSLDFSNVGIAACKNFIKVSDLRLPDLLNELAIAHGEGTFEKVIMFYQKVSTKVHRLTTEDSQEKSKCCSIRILSKQLHPFQNGMLCHFGKGCSELAETMHYCIGILRQDAVQSTFLSRGFIGKEKKCC